MNPAMLNHAIKEAERFVKLAKECRNVAETGEGWTAYPPKQSGSCKRASMDLTRALADLRRPS